MALELARSGVGHFLLIDNDRLAYHNICRHQCGIADVGRDKVEAVRERIWDINPTAEVTAVAQVLQRLTKDQLDVWAGPGSIIVGCADNRESDIYANRLSQIYGMPFVSIGLWERAFAGEIFWSIPSQTPCYLCMFGGQQNQLSFRQSENRRIYTTEYDASTVGFEPGISVDIGFVTDIGIKLVLDLIRRAEAPSRLLFSLKQFTLVCNTTRVRVPGDLQEMFDHPLQITRSIEVDGVPGCPHCALSLPIPEKGH
jgi:molybdopterin/thiamine biosynthesis adenylyltransferase